MKKNITNKPTELPNSSHRQAIQITARIRPLLRPLVVGPARAAVSPSNPGTEPDLDPSVPARWSTQL